MRNKKYLLIFLFPFFTMISMIFENVSPSLYAQNELMPLTVGNKWIGRVQVDSLGYILSTTYDTLLIVSDTTIEGELWYRSVDGVNLFRNDSTGLYTGELSGMVDIINHLKYPGIVGQYSIQEKFYALNQTNGIMDTILCGQKISLTDTLISVPAGDYNCYYYVPHMIKIDNSPASVQNPFVGWLWFSPDYGPIKLIYLDPSDQTATRKLIWELTYIELY